MTLSYKAIIKPKGVAWNPDLENDFDRFIDGLSAGSNDAYSILKQLGILRNPELIDEDLLGDLEREYGIISNESITIQERRDILESTMFAKPGTGSFTDLQTILNNAGFNVIVTPNDPAIDPNIIFASVGFMWADFGTSRANYIEAVTSNPIEIIVNTPYDSIENYKIIPGVHERWNYVFFVGGAASGWPSAPHIASASIPSASRGAFINLILKYKPLHSWCIPVIDWT